MACWIAVRYACRSWRCSTVSARIVRATSLDKLLASDSRRRARGGRSDASIMALSGGTPQVYRRSGEDATAEVMRSPGKLVGWATMSAGQYLRKRDELLMPLVLVVAQPVAASASISISTITSVLMARRDSVEGRGGQDEPRFPTAACLLQIVELPRPSGRW